MGGERFLNKRFFGLLFALVLVFSLFATFLIEPNNSATVEAKCPTPPVSPIQKILGILQNQILPSVNELNNKVDTLQSEVANSTVILQYYNIGHLIDEPNQAYVIRVNTDAPVLLTLSVCLRHMSTDDHSYADVLPGGAQLIYNFWGTDGEVQYGSNTFAGEGVVIVVNNDVVDPNDYGIEFSMTLMVQGKPGTQVTLKEGYG
jgi:hypothetical protein